jgi:hypothetical protein
MEDVELQKDPPGHGTACVEPARQYWPAAQPLYAVDPAVQNEPAGHAATEDVVLQ